MSLKNDSGKILRSKFMELKKKKKIHGVVLKTEFAAN